MGFERFADKQDKERKEKSERERKEEISRRMAFEKGKAEAAAEREKQRQLQMLKSGVERGMVKPEAAANAVSDLADLPGVAETLEAIELVESLPNVDAFLPRDLRLARGEYLLAVRSPDARAFALKKVDAALSHLQDQQWGGPLSLRALLGVFTAMGRSLTAAQEAQVDVKRDLSARNAA